MATRPPKNYSPEQVREGKERIVRALAEGKYLKDVCGKKGLPSQDVVQDWRRADALFAEQCAQARVDAAILRERQVSQLNDDVQAGRVAPDAARVALNALTWLAKVTAPKVYGDRVDVDHSGSVTLTVDPADAKL